MMPKFYTRLIIVLWLMSCAMSWKSMTKTTKSKDMKIKNKEKKPYKDDDLEKMKNVLTKLIDSEQFNEAYEVAKTHFKVPIKDAANFTSNQALKSIMIQLLFTLADKPSINFTIPALNSTIKSFIKYLFQFLKEVRALKCMIMEPFPPIELYCPSKEYLPGRTYGVGRNIVPRNRVSPPPTFTSTTTTQTSSTTPTNSTFDPPILRPEQNPLPLKSNSIRLGKHIYYFSTSALTWHQAVQACISIKADLAHPMNIKENNYIVGHLRTNFINIGDNWFLGGTDEHNEGQWIWVHNKAPMNFKFWGNGQPNNYGDQENCLELRRRKNYTWNDVKCSIKHRYICQFRQM